MIKFNINNNIKFKLADHGNQILRSYIDTSDWIPDKLDHIRGYLLDKYKADKEGYHTMQMWYAMSIFGNSLHIGAENVFESCLIYIDGSEDKS